MACALLFASLILFAMEMRSRIVSDVLALSAGSRQQWLIISRNDSISAFNWEVNESEGRADGWQSFSEAAFVFINTDIERLRSRPGFVEFHLPFWCLILPMTLLAGAFLFTKRRTLAR